MLNNGIRALSTLVIAVISTATSAEPRQSIFKAIRDAINPPTRAEEPNSAHHMPRWECPQQRTNSKSLEILGSQIGDVCALTSTLLASDGWYPSSNKPWVGFDGNGLLGTRVLSEVLRQYRDTVISAPKLNKDAPLSYTTFKSTENFPDGSKSYELTVVVEKYLDNPTTNTTIAELSRTFCAIDPTNSLSGGNSFRASLDQRYGAPSQVLTYQLKVDALVKKRTDSAARFKKINSTLGPAIHESRRNYLIAESESALEDLDREIAAASKLKNQVIALIWHGNQDEELSIMETNESCGNVGRQFKMTLTYSTEHLESIVMRATRSKAEFDKTRPSSAPIPRY